MFTTSFSTALSALSATSTAIDEARERLGVQGRLVIRPSGTEPLIRVMAEGDDRVLVEKVVNDIVDVISSVGNAA